MGEQFHPTLGFDVVIGIDTKIEVIVVSPTTWEAHQVVGDTTMTEIEVSISILSWCLKAH